MNERLILGINDMAGLRRLMPIDESMLEQRMTQAEFEHIAKLCQAFWLHSGNPKDPHAELTGGDCSNGFIDVLRILKYPNLCEIMARQVARIVRARCKGDIDWVIGSDHAGADLSHDVARYFNAQHDFTEKGTGKEQIWKRFPIAPGEIVLQVEELITTTLTLQEVRKGVRAGNDHPVAFTPVVATLVHRSDVYEFEGSPILHLVHYDIKKWPPADCPLCKAGSKRLRPKQHWAELTGGQ